MLKRSQTCSRTSLWTESGCVLVIPRIASDGEGENELKWDTGGGHKLQKRTGRTSRRSCGNMCLSAFSDGGSKTRGREGHQREKGQGAKTAKSQNRTKTDPPTAKPD